MLAFTSKANSEAATNIAISTSWIPKITKPTVRTPEIIKGK